jgi:hypothetical protein
MSDERCLYALEVIDGTRYGPNEQFMRLDFRLCVNGELHSEGSELSLFDGVAESGDDVEAPYCVHISSSLFEHVEFIGYLLRALEDQLEAIWRDARTFGPRSAHVLWRTAEIEAQPMLQAA